MHVVYIHQHFSTPGGSTGTRSYEMSQRLIASGHRVTMICGAYESSDLRGVEGELVTECEVAGIRVMRVAEPYANRMGFMQRVRVFGRFAKMATKIVRSLDADLVLATSTPLTVGIPGMKGAARLRVPFVFEVRDLWPEGFISVGLLKNPLVIWYARRLERKIYRAAHRIIALAPGIKDAIADTGYPADRIAMIPNGSDLELFQPDDRPLEDERFGAPDDFRVVFTGAHGRVNGLDAVLDAVVELRRRGHKAIRFVFIGDGSQRERLIERSKREQIDSMVSWIPPMPKRNLARILPGVDVGLMILKDAPALHYGTSPNKFFDYIASGLPVLNNYPGWLADLIRQNRCGVVVPPGDPAAFADAVVRLRDHREERSAMGTRARRLAETQFSREKLGQQFVETLEQTRAAFGSR